VETRIFGYLFPDKKGADKQTELGKLPRVSVHQFHGIEYDDSAAHIARLALILSEQQCNLHLEGHLQLFTAPLPLAAMPPIRHANALETPWAKKDTVYDFIIGNPPFVGSKMMSEQQRNEIKTIFDNKGGSGILDYVTGWYVLAAQYMQANPHTQTAFVSTNSITQGEQVGVLWKMLFDDYKIKINFAHQTFKWHNEASGVAAVHCVIIAFAAFTKNNKTIFEYPNINKEPLARKNIKNINSYLLSGKSVVIATRHKPITDVSAMSFGNMPLDGGNLLMTDEEKDVILKKEPLLERFIKPLVSAHEFLNGKKRWCFWLIDAQPTELKKSPELMRRIKAVKEFREASVAPSTRKFAETPQTFRDKNNPKNFILIPSTSSENRKYIPFGFFDKGEISHNSCHTVPNGDLFLFGNLTSAMHMAWVKYVCGRLKSDFRYSKDIVYNNYPFPTDVTAAKRAKVSSLAQAVLDLRAKYQKGEVTIAGEIGFGEGYTTASLADLYHALTMPQDLLKAHLALDKAVEQCYRKEAFKSDTERVEFLFERYEGLV
jgi:hypothetical protein